MAHPAAEAHKDPNLNESGHTIYPKYVTNGETENINGREHPVRVLVQDADEEEALSKPHPEIKNGKLTGNAGKPAVAWGKPA